MGAGTHEEWEQVHEDWEQVHEDWEQVHKDWEQVHEDWVRGFVKYTSVKHDSWKTHYKCIVS